MRFGFWPSPWVPFEEMLDLSQHAEATGWDGLWFADHFMPAGTDTSRPWPEAWMTMAAVAARVPRVRVGTMVTGNTYRHPAVLAKMAATLDHITAGRVVLGLGAGWQENEHRKYGIHYGTIPERLARLDEACHVIKSLYAQTSSDFEGRFYQLDGATLEPKPVQQPLPLMIGGSGEKVTLKIVAKYADEWNDWGDLDHMKRKMAVLDAHCAAIDRDPAEIQRSAAVLLFMSNDRATVEKAVSNHPDNRPTATKSRLIFGTPSEVRDKVAEMEAAGVHELIITDAVLGDTAQKKETMDLLMREVAGR